MAAPQRRDLHNINLCDQHYQRLMALVGPDASYRDVVDMAAALAIEFPCHVRKCACGE